MEEECNNGVEARVVAPGSPSSRGDSGMRGTLDDRNQIKAEDDTIEGRSVVYSGLEGEDISERDLKQDVGVEQTPGEVNGVQDSQEHLEQLHSSLDEQDSYEETDGDQNLSLLKYCRDKKLTEQKLRVILKKKHLTEDVDLVDEDCGALHYLVTRRHKNKPVLLELLVVLGGASVDLTTTMDGYTALRLAVEHSDYESAEVLISLDADVNAEDFFGNTPLDIAIRKSSLKKSASGDFKLTHLNSNQELEESGIEDSEERSTLDRIKELLLSVGAHPGSSSKTRHHRSPRTRHNRKHSPEARATESHTVETEAFNFKKINTVYYKEVHDKHREWITRSHILHPPKAGEADDIMRKMAEAEEYRKRCGSRILFLDGGGVRGLVQMAVLGEIERRTGRKIVELFDWIVGTSTGGIIALALTYGPLDPHLGVRQTKTVRQLRDIYWSMKDEIFGAAQDGFLGFLARGDTKRLEEILQVWLGKDTSLKDVTYPKVLIPAVSKKHSNLEMHFFNNCFNDEHSRELAWKVARYTSAAPFYFKEFDGYIDGGMMANNPSEVGLTEIQKFYHKRGEKLPISMVVSIGSGINPGTPLGEIDIKSNLLDPKRYCDLLSVLAAAVVNWPAHSSCEVRCREEGISYYRFNPTLSEKVTSEQHDSRVLQRMILTTRKYLHSMKEDIDDLVTNLKGSDLTSTLTVTD